MQLAMGEKAEGHSMDESPTEEDPEIAAMRVIDMALRGLDRVGAVDRVLAWAVSKHGSCNLSEEGNPLFRSRSL